jgi:hypothetical protein
VHAWRLVHRAWRLAYRASPAGVVASPVADPSSVLGVPHHASLDLGPAAIERPAAAGRTVLGVLDPSSTGAVDGAGLVTTGRGWSLDWWIGGDDRWYLPAREPTVRQRRIGAGPVVETTVRVPGGDAVHRVWAARSPAGEVLVVEVENASPVPFALGLAVRPYGLDGSGGLSEAVLDGVEVRLDGRPALWLPRPPNERGARADRDVVGAVTSGADLSWPGPASDPGGAVTAVLLFPVPHRTRLRVALPLGETGPAAAVAPAELADHEAVARGWDAVVGAGARLTLPDPGLSDRIAAFRARILLAAPGSAVDLAELVPGSGLVVAALAAGGHETEALRAVSTLASVPLDPVTPLPAVVEATGAAALAVGLADDRRVESAATETLVDLVGLVDRRRTRRAATPALAALASHLERAGHGAAADALARRLGTWPDPWQWAGLDDGDPIESLLTGISGTGAFVDDDPVAAARALLSVRRRIARETADGLELFPDFPAAWRGGGAEVHRLPTLFGRLSFALRWHGYRPALLWELERRAGDPVVALRCPGLDPRWSSTEPRGEALLAGSADGLTRPPAEGESFS